MNVEAFVFPMFFIQSSSIFDVLRLPRSFLCSVQMAVEAQYVITGLVWDIGGDTIHRSLDPIKSVKKRSMTPFLNGIDVENVACWFLFTEYPDCKILGLGHLHPWCPRRISSWSRMYYLTKNWINLSPVSCANCMKWTKWYNCTSKTYEVHSCFITLENILSILTHSLIVCSVNRLLLESACAKCHV